jgi:predicted nucleotidyltransferase
MLAQKTVINKLKKITEEIKHSGIHLNRVVLFGSYAKNAQHKWSDIDVALVADEFISSGFEDVGLFAATLIKYPNLNISPRTYNTRDFSPERDPFVEIILKTGIEIA